MQSYPNNQNNEATAHIKRNHGVYYAVKYIFGWLVKALAQFSFTPYKPKNDTYLLISNHTTMMDPVYLAIALKPYLRFVSSDHLLRMGAWGKFITYCVNPIPKRRGGDSHKTMDMIKNSLQSGVNVCLFAEGFCSINGETNFISPRTGQLVKDSGAGLLTYKFVGGYFKDPRWAHHSRFGRFHGEVAGEYTPEELQKMTVDEINEVIRRDLYINAYEEQRKNLIHYKGKNLAEDLETILYICPKCKAIGKMHSHHSTLSCECGYTMDINDYGFFEGKDLVFDNVLDWDKWQKRYLKENLEIWKNTEGVITSDDDQIFYCIEDGGKKKMFSKHCTAELYRDRIEIIDKAEQKSKVIYLRDIVKMSLGGEMKVSFTANDNYYELQSNIIRSGVKYFAFYRILTGKDYF